MIVDGHAYCFPPMGEANGFPSAEEHLRYVQREMADHHQPVWRLADRAQGDNARLADPTDRTLAGLLQVGFRAGGYGRFVWTVDGQLYAKQYLPPYLADLSHTPDMLMWGTDMPNVERFCTYRQTLETFTVHCRGRVAEADIANIVGGTAARLFGLDAGAPGGR